jgi:hypothetical protein
LPEFPRPGKKRQGRGASHSDIWVKELEHVSSV